MAPSRQGALGFRSSAKGPCLHIVGLDHVALLVHDLASARAAYRQFFGRAPSWEGDADGVATTIFTLANTSLELMAPNGAGAGGDRVRAALETSGEGIASLAFRSVDLARLHRRLGRVGLEPDAIADGESRDLATGRLLRWRRFRAATTATRGIRLFFLELAEPRPLSPALDEAGAIAGIDHLVIGSANLEAIAALYGARLGLELALDRPSQGKLPRLMFFRCGDMVVEIAEDKGADPARDRHFGLSWRTPDILATHARLGAAGLPVSELRQGRKPGTRVFTLRGGACGVPTLVIEPSERR